MIESKLRFQLEQFIKCEENKNANGSINWDFVNADLYINNPDVDSDELRAALDTFKDEIEVDYSTDFTDWMNDDNGIETSIIGEIY